MLPGTATRRIVAALTVLALLTVSGCGSDPERGRVAAIEGAAAPARASTPSSAGSPSVAASTGVAGPATATTPAVRVDPPARSDCEAIARGVAVERPSATHLVVVTTDDWDDSVAVLRVATRSGTAWTCGPNLGARIGRTGFRPLADRRSGDGTTPAGVFPLATMTAWDGATFSFFGNAPDPGVSAGTYRRVKTGDCFGATPNTAGYGHLRYDTSCPGPDDEYLPRFVQAYTSAALIGANMEPDVSGDAPGEIAYAAAIFLHRHVYDGAATKPTSGCVSLAQADLDRVLVGMKPGTLFVMGPTSWLLDR